MGTYKATLNSGVSVKDGVKIEWEVATQEELAYAYEELGMTDIIEKVSTRKPKDEKAEKVSTKKGSSKETGTDTDENTDE